MSQAETIAELTQTIAHLTAANGSLVAENRLAQKSARRDEHRIRRRVERHYLDVGRVEPELRRSRELGHT